MFLEDVLNLTSTFYWRHPIAEIFMFDAGTTALLRSILDEICDGVSLQETGVRTHVASKILEAATRGEISADELRQIGREALKAAPWQRSFAHR